MPFRRPRVWAGGKPAISMRACAGVVHAFGSRRLGYPVTTFARPVQAGPEAGPGGSGKGSPLASWLSTTGHKISSIGSWMLGASTFLFLCNICKTWKYGERVTKDDPWGYGNSLEWATSCPPPRHNFTKIPRIRSGRPASGLHYPHIQAGRTRRPVPPVSTRLLREHRGGDAIGIRHPAWTAKRLQGPFRPGTRGRNQPAGQAFLLLGTDQGAQIGDDGDVR